MKKRILLAMITVVLVQACTATKEAMINPVDQVPVSVVESIKAKYPGASDIKYSVLETDKVYQANFRLDGNELAVVTNTNQILNTTKYLGRTFSDSLRNKMSGLGIESGALSNYRVLEVPGQSVRHVADYSLRGSNYSLTIDATGMIDMASRQVSFETRSVADLPEKIQAFISARSKANYEYISKLPLLQQELKDYLKDKQEFVFTSSTAYLLPDNSKQYQVYVKFYGITDLPLIFDENSNLIWIGSFNRLESLTNFDDLTGGLSNVSQQDLNYFADQFKASSELKDYQLDVRPSSSQAALNVYENHTGYQFHISKPSVNSTESWVLRYDSKRKLIDSYYSGQQR
ncbi:hypothetical protein L0657_23520 [Dyadobacter sp. CY345]|uniref:hypothetical protein n=1 Tax=Dyadobacter sp. CY345 TaxID=2909335 RepID=UPI001F4062A5|nr:hypothetical protein [Dyadobacter sp. CY345]MCF2446944.1 hypothetical protein [Dyadobacter sp. CY345]